MNTDFVLRFRHQVQSQNQPNNGRRRNSPVSSPLFVLAASATEASEWKHSIWQQMLSATIPQKYSKTFSNKEAFDNESWPDGRAKYVPNGLRMVETLLLRKYSEDDVVVCYVDQLERFVVHVLE